MAKAARRSLDGSRAKEGFTVRTKSFRVGAMHYVYLLRSEVDPDRTYIGSTSDLKERLNRHNAGGSINTEGLRPWKLVTYLAFSSREQAANFERYLKSGSGRAFARKRLW